MLSDCENWEFWNNLQKQYKVSISGIFKGENNTTELLTIAGFQVAMNKVNRCFDVKVIHSSCQLDCPI